MKTREKRPEDKLLIVVNYTQRLATTDSIVSAPWEHPTGLNIAQGDFGINGTHYTWCILSEGTAGEYYQIENTITSAQGEKKKTVIPIFVKDEVSAII